MSSFSSRAPGRSLLFPRTRTCRHTHTHTHTHTHRENTSDKKTLAQSVSRVLSVWVGSVCLVGSGQVVPVRVCVGLGLGRSGSYRNSLQLRFVQQVVEFVLGGFDFLWICCVDHVTEIQSKKKNSLNICYFIQCVSIASSNFYSQNFNLTVSPIIKQICFQFTSLNF